MKNNIGISFFSLIILSIPNQIFAELILDRKSYDYGFFIGSLSESCILYKYGDISSKILRETYESIFFNNLKDQDREVQIEVLKYARNKEFPCKDFVPYDY